jgi:hypothetical protein
LASSPGWRETPRPGEKNAKRPDFDPAVRNRAAIVRSATNYIFFFAFFFFILAMVSSCVAAG